MSYLRLREQRRARLMRRYRLSEAQLIQLEEAARETGRSVGEVIRQLGIDKTVNSGQY